MSIWNRHVCLILDEQMLMNTIEIKNVDNVRSCKRDNSESTMSSDDEETDEPWILDTTTFRQCSKRRN